MQISLVVNSVSSSAWPKNSAFLWRTALHLVSPVRQGAPQSDFICVFSLARPVRHSSLHFLLASRTFGTTGIFSDSAWKRKFKVIKFQILSEKFFTAFPVSDRVTTHTNYNLGYHKKKSLILYMSDWKGANLYGKKNAPTWIRLSWMWQWRWLQKQQSISLLPHSAPHSHCLVSLLIIFY